MECVHRPLPTIPWNVQSRTSKSDDPSSIRIPPLALFRPRAFFDPESFTATLVTEILLDLLIRIGKFTTFSSARFAIVRPSTRSVRIPFLGYHTRNAFSGGAISSGFDSLARLP